MECSQELYDKDGDIMMTEAEAMEFITCDVCSSIVLYNFFVLYYIDAICKCYCII